MRTAPRRRTLMVGVVLVGVLIGVAAAAIPFYVQSRLAAALRSSLQARRVQVSIRAAPQAALAGRFEGLTIVIEEFHAGRLPVQQLRAELTGVEIDRGRLTSDGELVLRRLSGGTVEATVTAAGLQEYLTTGGSLRGARVRLADGRATVRGTIRVLTFDVTAIMRGEFVIPDDRRIAFRVREISLGDLALPPEVGQALTASMNPLVTADDFPVPVRFTSITADRGELVLRANASR